MTNVNIVEVSRIGRAPGEQTEENGSERKRGGPRPLLVKMYSAKDKWNVIKEGNRLKKSNREDLRNIRIAADLTYRERERENKKEN